jgi:hypothetical protein
LAVPRIAVSFIPLLYRKNAWAINSYAILTRGL